MCRDLSRTLINISIVLFSIVLDSAVFVLLCYRRIVRGRFYDCYYGPVLSLAAFESGLLFYGAAPVKSPRKVSGDFRPLSIICAAVSRIKRMR